MSWDPYAEGWDEDEGARARTYSQAAFESLGRVNENAPDSHEQPVRGHRH